MNRRFFITAILACLSALALQAEPTSGYFRMKTHNGQALAGGEAWSLMESEHYCGIHATEASRHVLPGTVFHLQLLAQEASGAYPIDELRAQNVNVMDNIMWCKTALQVASVTDFETLRAAFAAGAASIGLSTEAVDAINAYTYAEFQTWASNMEARMRIASAGTDGGTDLYYVYVDCEEFPLAGTADITNDNMSTVWAGIVESWADLVDRFLPDNSLDGHKVLGTTVKSMLKKFKFGDRLYLGENTTGEFVFFNLADDVDNQPLASWEIETIEGDNYFGFAPDPAVTDGKGFYYATLYTDFSYQLPAGVRAYYIDKVEGNMAHLKEIGGNVVPRGVPVILRSRSTDPSDNRLTPLEDDYTSLYQTLREKNLLIYYNNLNKTTAKNHNFLPAYGSGVKVSAGDNTRTFGLTSDGKPGFFSPADGDYHLPNLGYIVAAPADVYLFPDYDEISNGYYRIRNLQGTTDGREYGIMESNRYASVTVKADERYTKPGTVFYVELNSPDVNNVYNMRQLRAQNVNAVNQLAYIPAFFGEMGATTFNTLIRPVFAAVDPSLATYDYQDFRTWMYGHEFNMKLINDGGVYSVYDDLADFPTGADKNEAMNQAWADQWNDAAWVAQVESLINLVLAPTAEHKELVATTISMMKEFRFGGRIYLAEDENGEFVFVNQDNYPSTNALWDMEPVVNDEGYFGLDINPIFTEGRGYYYTSILLDFAAQVPDDVNIWYIGSLYESNAKAQPVKLSGKIIPRFTPVILESPYTSAADNKLLPVDMTTALWEQANDIKATNFLEYSGITARSWILNNNTNVNFFPSDNIYGPANDTSHLRVFSISSGGVLGFYKYSQPYIPVNKPYLDMTLHGNPLLSGGLSIVLNFGGETTGIDDVRTSYPEPRTSDAVYTLDGRKAATGQLVNSSTGQLPKGIYIVNGKKVIVK